MRRRSLLTDARLRRAEVGGRPVTRWTAPQRALFDSPHKLTVLWGANGIGKSVAMGEYCVRAIAGELHWQRPGPQVVMLAGNTWSQLGSTIKYMMEGRLRGWLPHGVRYEGGTMKGQRLAIFSIVDGPGKGGELRLGTFRARNLAGPRANVVVTDEPMPESVYAELWPRLLGRGGRMVQGFTPTLGTAHDVGYLWELVDDQTKPWAGEIHVPLTLEAVTPRGGLLSMPWMTQDEISTFEQGLPEIERDLRMGRSRTPRRDQAYFSAWRPDLVRHRPLSELAGWRLGVGIDHGSKPGSQRAIVVACGGSGLYSHLHVLAEYQAEGRTSTREDARAILDMLDRLGVSPADVDVWKGDRAHHGDRRGGKKSNQRLKAALAEQMGHDTRRRGWSEKLPEPLRYMSVPRKFDGSVWEGSEILHRLMVDDPPRFSVDPAAVHIQHDLASWEGSTSPTDPWKHGIDALRYIGVPMAEGRRR